MKLELLESRQLLDGALMTAAENDAACYSSWFAATLNGFLAPVASILVAAAIHTMWMDLEHRDPGAKEAVAMSAVAIPIGLVLTSIVIAGGSVAVADNSNLNCPSKWSTFLGDLEWAVAGGGLGELFIGAPLGALWVYMKRPLGSDPVSIAI